MPRIAWAISLSTLAGGVACSLSLDADRVQCKRQEDCSGHGLDARAICIAGVCSEPAVVVEIDAGDAEAPDARTEDPVWGCLDDLPPAIEPDPTVPVRSLARFYAILNSTPLAGLPVKACLPTDLTCAEPLGASVTGANGFVAFDLYHGFTGYLDISPSAEEPDIMPSVFYVQPIPDKNVPASEERPPGANLVKHSEFAFLSGSVGKEVKQEYGHLLFGALNCQSAFVANTIGRAEPISVDTFTIYTDAAGTPSLTAGKTTDSGQGGYINLPPGMVTVTLNRDDGRRIATREVLIRKGSITYALIGPRR
ncbi:MAG TPA: hypothetical protein VM925_04135 [Labilithrix sp.]|nr:hypothetical protein [Labilithrix sp.]